MMPSSTKFQTTLQRLKEQIVSLTVEHEDKGHFLALLEKKCAQKREELTNLSEKYSKEAELVLERDNNQYDEIIAKKIKDANEQIEYKKSLMKSCQDLVNEITLLAKEHQTMIREIVSECDSQFEADHKLFKSGQQERLIKFLSKKQLDIKETTQLAMSPEFRRLEQLEKRELAELDNKLQLQRLEISVDFSQRYKLDLANFIQSIETTTTQRLQELNNRHEQNVELVEHECRKKIEAIQIEIEQDREKLQVSLAKRNEKDRKKGQSEIHAVQDEVTNALQLEQQRHAREVADVKKNHDLQVRELLQNAKKMKEKLVAKMPPTDEQTELSNPQSQLQYSHPFVPGTMSLEDTDTIFTSFRQSLNMHIHAVENTASRYTEGPNTASNALTSTSLFRTFNSSATDIPIETSPTSSAQHNRSAGRLPTVAPNDLGSQLSVKSYESVINQVTEECRKLRDDTIKNEIKKIQKDSYVSEKSCAQRFEKEKANIVSIAELEENELRIKISGHKDSIVDCALTKDNLLSKLNNMKFHMKQNELSKSQLDEAIKQLRTEISTYRSKQYANDCELCQLKSDEEKHRDGLRQQQVTRTHIYQTSIDSLEAQLSEARSSLEKARHESELQHLTQLETLDKEVKLNLASKDAELTRKKDELDAEMTKIDTLKSLIVQYSGNSFEAGIDSNNDILKLSENQATFKPDSKASRPNSQVDNGSRNGGNRITPARKCFTQTAPGSSAAGGGGSTPSRQTNGSTSAFDGKGRSRLTKTQGFEIIQNR